MNIDYLFFRLYGLTEDGKEEFLGTGFPVTEGGGLLTCRHVVDVDRERLPHVTLHDNLTGYKIHAKEIRFPEAEDLDLAFLPGLVPKANRTFFPLLPVHPPTVFAASLVFTWGFYRVRAGRWPSEPPPHPGPVEQGFFSGRLVSLNKTESGRGYLTLPFPVLEGMSGCPILIEQNGPKVVGVGFGSRQTRVAAYEVKEYEEERTETGKGGERVERIEREERIDRVVEFGHAYHGAEVLRFLEDVGASGYRVTDGPHPGLGFAPPRQLAPWPEGDT